MENIKFQFNKLTKQLVKENAYFNYRRNFFQSHKKELQQNKIYNIIEHIRQLQENFLIIESQEILNDCASSFNWKETSEGYEYWKEIYEKMLNYKLYERIII